MRHFLTFRHGGWVTFALGLLCIPLGIKSQQFCNIDTTSFTPGSITHSCFGAAHTPQRNLHILVVFVRYEVNQASYDTIQWPDNPTLPQFAQDALGLPGFNQLFASDTNQIKNHPNFQNLSQFYYEASNGKFLLTADIYPEQVQVPWNTSLGKMCLNALDSISAHEPSFDWARYDNRTNNPNYGFDNSISPTGDSLLDYVVFIHRWGAPGARSGFATESNHQIPGTPFRLNHFHSTGKTSSDIVQHYGLFVHEFAHNLFNCPHYMGGNSAVTGNKPYNRIRRYAAWVSRIRANASKS